MRDHAPGISGVRCSAPRTDQSVGPLHPGVEARITKQDGTLALDGGIGELLVRGPNVMRGYYRAPELTRKAVDAVGWFNIGDLERCENGGLYIVGRTKEMIISSGSNVYPAEVEAVLNSRRAVGRGRSRNPGQ
jgi:long-chain acyl-CoA synthetase